MIELLSPCFNTVGIIGWVAYIVVMAIATAVSYMMAPDVAGADTPDTDDYEFPTITEGRAHPVLFGRKKMDAPNVSWWGDVYYKSIKK